jgi:hypothetical protein
MPPIPRSRRALLIGIDYVNMNKNPDVAGAGVDAWPTLEAQDDARNFGRFLISAPGAVMYRRVLMRAREQSAAAGT